MDDYEVRAGELLFLKSHVRHYGKTLVKTGTRWIFAHFYLEEPDSGLEPFVFGDPVLSDQLDGRLSRTLLLPKKMEGLRGSPLEAALHRLVEYVFSPNPVKKLYANIRLYEILCGCALASYQNSGSNRLTDRIAAYLEAHVDSSFSSEKLEKQSFRTYKHIETTFKKDKGVTPYQYHTSLRIRMACQLLRSTALPIGDVAGKTGYEDPLYFSRVFRKSMGVSPGQYRRRFFRPEMPNL